MDTALHPLPWGHPDWGCCQSPFHHLLLTVGIAAFQGCEPRQILAHTEVQNCAVETAPTASHLYPLASSSHKHGIPTTFVPPDPPNTMHTAAETLERLTRDPILVNMTFMQGEPLPMAC